MEELCFLFVDRAELLDAEVVQRDMVRWLEAECGLSDLAHTLDALLKQKRFHGGLCGRGSGVCEYLSA